MGERKRTRAVYQCELCGQIFKSQHVRHIHGALVDDAVRRAIAVNQSYIHHCDNGDVGVAKLIGVAMEGAGNRVKQDDGSCMKYDPNDWYPD